MRLSQFIRDHLEAILQEWESFALTFAPLANAPRRALRDHAGPMLMVICADLDTYQDESESIEKSQGNGPALARETAAEAHAVERTQAGFAVEELVAEYRAMRASVLRLWQAHSEGADATTLRDMRRFNEAIDQSVAESVARHAAMTRDAQNVFLAILGHDVRNPLGAIGMGAQMLLLDAELPAKHSKVAGLIARSTRRVGELVEDLIDFSTSRLGRIMPIKPAPFDFAPQCRLIVEELRTFHPERTLVLDVTGDLNVVWDQGRVNQALSNLLANAIQHGAADQPVSVRVDGADTLTLTIHNMGEPIAPADLRALFDPVLRFAMAPSDATTGDMTAPGGTDNLGLGLYITRDIVVAHGGEITVSSTAEDGTTFMVTLPREAQGSV
jgi:signal transduction histidine kinase